ncbi:hypothetical protein RFI_33261, partial [Reticulomyxa filosa]
VRLCIRISEISSENLLCYTELVQYQQLFKFCEEDCQKELEDIEISEWDGKLVKCEDNGIEIIPLSEIICSVLSVERQSQITSVTILQLYDIARQLATKYLENKSSYQINISEMDRNYILHAFDQGDNPRDAITAANVRFFYALFRDCVREMYFLMNGAFTRFVFTNEYEQIKGDLA